jgi:hypothetical protein
MLPSWTQAEGNAEDAQWGIVPVPEQNPATTAKGYFVYPIQPGGRASGQVLLRNPGTTPVTIVLATVNAETAQQGGSAFSTEEGSASSIAGWIELGERQATLPPGTQRPISFSVHTPAGIKPGQYLAGIAASEAPAATTEATTALPGLGANIAMHSRYVIGVQADIGSGWTPAMRIAAVSALDQPSGTVIGVQLMNDGDIFLKPSGTILITDATGQQLLSQALEMGTFVPGTAVTYPIAWPGQPAAGTYSVAIDLEYAEGKHALYSSTFDVSGAVEQHAAERANVEAVPQIAPKPAAMLAPLAGIQPWMIYVLGGLLLLIVLLLILNLVRGRSKVRSA